MPIYEYSCQESTCSHRVEALQKISDLPLVDCEVCGKPSLKRCVSAPSVRFTGSGYYETDEKPKSKQRHIATTDNHQPKVGSSNLPKKEKPKEASSSTTG